jgi:hypothetical protein
MGCLTLVKQPIFYTLQILILVRLMAAEYYHIKNFESKKETLTF